MRCAVRRGKYNARKTTVDNIVFDSQKEARRYQELKLLERAGEIRNLVLQPSYSLNALGVGALPIGVYRADFGYEWRVKVYDAQGLCRAGTDGHTWKPVVEDVKGFRTPLYRFKKKFVEAQYGITIRET